MVDYLLQTKLNAPLLRPSLVPRPHLIKQLNQGLKQNHKLTLISAPAGFGKTTLVTEWIHQLENVAWLSLDESDNDLARFFTYLIAALQEVDKSLGIEIQAALQAPQTPPIENLLTMLINDIAAIKGGPATDSRHRFILVIEDYHLIENQPIHEALAFLLEHLPSRMHLVITSRDDPFLPLARWRVRGLMTEIRAKQLRFSSQETTAYLNQVMGLGLPSDDVAALETRTEGWIAGLHLAALSLQEHEDAATFISAFTGDDRYIVDYLVGEVLAQRPQGTREFLLQTSVLDRMTGPLCDAVTGQKNGTKVLWQLEQANLFIVPLDNRRRWYRYHYLFADLLRQRLEESTSLQEKKNLHRRASQWYEENDFFVEAIEHALTGGDFENAIRLIELNMEEIFRRNQVNILLGWWEKLPHDLVIQHPPLCMSTSWAWVARGLPEEAELCLKTTEQALGAKADELFVDEGGGQIFAPEIQSGLAEVTIIRAQLAIGRGDIAQALRLTSRVLPYLEDDNQPFLHNPPVNLRNLVLFIMGMAHKLQGDLRLAGEALSKAAELANEQRNIHLVSPSFGNLASVQVIQGQLHQAASTCRRGLQLVQEVVGERSPISSLCQAELGNVLYEQNDLESAQSHLQEAIAVAKPWGHWEGLLPGYTGLAWLKVAQGKWDEGFAALDELVTLIQNLPHIMPAVESLRAKLWVAQGNVDPANRWAQSVSLEVDSEITAFREADFIILARILMAQGSFDEAAKLIARLLDMAESGERWGRVIELLSLKALVSDATSQSDEAFAALSRALALAEPEGYVRIFIDAGTPMEKLLQKAVERGIAPHYIGRLLAAFPQVESTTLAQTKIPTPNRLLPMVEPLSHREIEVLSLIVAGHSNKEIAQKLYLSPGTIKVHAHNIYSKLGVNGRTQAVAKARDLGILPS